MRPLIAMAGGHSAGGPGMNHKGSSKGASPRGESSLQAMEQGTERGESAGETSVAVHWGPITNKYSGITRRRVRFRYFWARESQR